ncbi:cGMP-specific 3',5'-cyclic phosphodiesterase-like [Aplochiton taeniatus]
MPCLYSEGMESESPDESTPGPSPCCDREQPSSNPFEDELTVVTSAGWFFSPLWSPRANTRRWGFGNGVESIKVEAWLDDHSDVTQGYNSRRASMESGYSVKRDSKGRLNSSSEPSSSMMSPGRRRESFPPQGPYLCIPSADRPQSLTPTASGHDWSENPFTQERVGRCHRSPAASPHPSPCCGRSPRSPRRSGLCGRGEGCEWMMGYLSGGPRRMGSVAELCQGALVHAAGVVSAQRCGLSLLQKVVGAVVVITKNIDGAPVCGFTDLDEKVLSSHMALLGMVLDNAQLYESSRQEAKRSQVLLDLARLVSEEQWSLEEELGKMAATIMPFTHAQYCTVFITDEQITDCFSRVVHMELEDSGTTFKITKRECDITEVDQTYALRTLSTMETLNVSENTQDPTRSLICCPVRKSNKVIAVCQLRNKYSKEVEVFNRYDERLLEDLALYCGLALQNAQTFHITEKRKASLVVTEEVLSYHITAAEEEIRALQEAPIPSAESLKIIDFKFNDFGLSEEATTQAAVRMFLDLNLVQEFNIDYNSLCQWVLSVRRGYRNVPYHNWSHGLSTAQCMFAMLMTTGELQEKFSRLEVLALMIATLNHDLDHRGVSNSYIERSQHPIAHLYGHSSLEHHHYALCLFILNNPGSQILSGLSEEDHRIVLPMIERAILATDLAVYIERRSEFFNVAKKGEVCWSNERHRDLLRSMLMTASDISAITKPWSVQRRTAKLVATEFFAQGDRERQEFNIKPIDVMNRDNITRLPHMQVEYIDGICDPLYDALSGLFDCCSPLREGCRKNRDNWQHLAEGEEEPEDDE